MYNLFDDVIGKSLFINLDTTNRAQYRAQKVIIDDHGFQ